MNAALHDAKSALRRRCGRLKSLTATTQPGLAGLPAAALKTRKSGKTPGRFCSLLRWPEELDIWPLLSDTLAGGKIRRPPPLCAKTGTYVACAGRDLDHDLSRPFGIREPAAHCGEVYKRLVALETRPPYFPRQKS